MLEQDDRAAITGIGQVAGVAKQAKGSVKKAAGGPEAEGTVQKAHGDVKDKVRSRP
jgi:uncharacterized protein YjbJ (UPF0337 family)